MMFIIEIILVTLLLTVLFYDLLTYTIPNWLVLLVMALYVPVPFLVEVDWPWALGAAGIGLVLGFGMFAVGWVGGGDAKLLAAIGLWTGKGAALPFLFNMAIIGGILTLLLVAMRFALAVSIKRKDRRDRLPKLLHVGSPVPYGVAMALGMLLLMQDQSASLPF